MALKLRFPDDGNFYFDQTGISVRSEIVAVACLIAAPSLVAVVGVESAANAQSRHSSVSKHVYCLSKRDAPGRCTGFMVGKGVTVQMTCWNTGPSVFHSKKWFRVIVKSGKGHGKRGELPANDVARQWRASPRC